LAGRHLVPPAVLGRVERLVCHLERGLPRISVERKGGDANAPVYMPDPAKPYAHPYYWAPFVLMGNWL
jgi:CHAT domain-containing protein